MQLPKRPPSPVKLLESLTAEGLEALLRSSMAVSDDGRYLHWDQIRHCTPPAGMTHEQWWFVLGMARRSQQKLIPLKDDGGLPFRFTVPERVQSALHDVTRRTSGSIGVPDQVTNPAMRDRYLIRNLMEEGITSSQIEGASTTRVIAKEMLRTKRPPRNRSEQMILNNYQAMQFIIDSEKERLTPEFIFQLHELLTVGTLDDSSDVGRLRGEGERIDVVDPRDNEVLHVPPPASELPHRLEAMCAFANGETPEGFVDPVIRSIILHFWLAYDHPFKDGNGRCARALFYWSMLRRDYWLFQFVSISQIIHRAPAKYARAFLYTETDENDLTYFIIHQLEVIQKAIAGLYSYIDERLANRRRLESRMRLASELNERQLHLLEHALRHPNAQYDIAQYRAAEGVVYETARTDLMRLAELGLLAKSKRGRTWYFRPAPYLENRLDDMS